MSKIDLHIHSSFSDDGEFTPAQIMQQCRKQGMKLVAVTDHNSVAGVEEAMKSAQDIKVISGVELDCTYKGRNFHLLGYGFDYTADEFWRVEQDILRQEKEAAAEKINLFRMASGIPIEDKEVFAAAQDGVVTGELIAELVLAKEDAAKYELLRPYLPGGSKSDMPNVRFYWDFFSEGKPAYVAIKYLTLADAVQMIQEADGMAVLAHPGQNLAGDDSMLYDMLSEKKSIPLDAIEAFSTYHSEEEARRYVKIAEENHLFVTCGSDFHGKHKPSIKLGGHGSFRSDREIMSGLPSFCQP